jgi:dipeptidyl aminopeptidase/acylaminoacyl peptidase
MTGGYIVLGRPDWTQPRLAPAGDRMAAVRWHDGAANVWIGSSKAPMQLASDLRPWRLRDFHWGIDGRGLVLVLDDAGVRQRSWIAWLDLRSGTLTRLTPERASDPQYVGQVGTDRPRILIAIRHAVSGGSELQEVTPTGEVMSRWAGPGLPVSSWLATESQVVAACPSRSATTWWHSHLPDVAWSRIAEMPAADGLGSHPIAFGRDGRSLYAISSASRDTLALVQMSPPAWSPVVLSAKDRFDVTTVLMSPDGAQPDIVSSTDPQARQAALGDAGVADLARLAQIASGAPARIVDRNATHCLAEVSYQSGGPAYLTFSRTTKAVSRPLVRYTGLSRVRMHEREPFSYHARDGLPITGFLTRPSSQPPWPAVLLIHDGPWTRDSASMDPWAQYVASAGFCCIQVNFRGSRGFGKRFRDAGDRQWSGAMQDDLIDALRSESVSAVIDHGRLAAIGHGYGGYAALMLAAQSEVELSCAVSASAPTDLVVYVTSLMATGGPGGRAYASRVGDPAAEGERLAHASPVSRADDFGSPVLLFHGRQDARIPVSHATSLADSLRRAGKRHDLVVYDDEGHWFTRPQNVADFRLRTVEFVLTSTSQDADLEVSP